MQNRNHDDSGKDKKNTPVTDVSTPVQLEVTDPVSVSADPATLQKGTKANLVVKVRRLGQFTGPVNLSLTNLPKGVQCPAVTVDAEVEQGTLIISVPTDAVAGSFPGVKLQASVKVAENINIDRPLELKVE